MKQVKRRKVGNAWLPYTLRPRKQYPFPTPIPPQSVVRCISSPSSCRKKDVGRLFRIGYDGQKDGLDCIWLVNEKGKYEQTIDYDFLEKHFETIAKERSLYGKNRAQLVPVE